MRSYTYRRKGNRLIDGDTPPMPPPTLSPAQEKAELLRLARLCEEGWSTMTAIPLKAPPMPKRNYPIPERWRRAV
ncbi:MAG TPA: hypothetical protein VK789_09390 [Bryobacteraceae bacterium]|jgi:hypothetical protein|nr:hypothetical protein [Bryobacteraceae bacterium]